MHRQRTHLGYVGIQNDTKRVNCDRYCPETEMGVILKWKTLHSQIIRLRTAFGLSFYTERVASASGHRERVFVKRRRGRVQAENKATKPVPRLLLCFSDGVACRRVRAALELQSHLQSNTC